MRLFTPIFIAAAVLMCVGCSTPKRLYEVQVMNVGTRPISAGLVKTGPPAEMGWLSPEMINAPQDVDRHWGELIQPGETKVLSRLGKFEEGTDGVLRIYDGDRSVSDLIGFGRNDPGRLDIFLTPGSSSFVVDNRSGRLRINRDNGPGNGRIN